jgi:hypothetical protein
MRRTFRPEILKGDTFNSIVMWFKVKEEDIFHPSHHLLNVLLQIANKLGLSKKKFSCLSFWSFLVVRLYLSFPLLFLFIVTPLFSFFSSSSTPSYCPLTQLKQIALQGRNLNSWSSKLALQWLQLAIQMAHRVQRLQTRFDDSLH